MIRQLTTLSLLALVASCTTQKVEPPKPAFDSSRNPDLLTPDLYPHGAVAEKEPVVRYGRYTLVSTQPDAGQRDLMAQIIDVTIPANMHPNVRDAMQYVVDRSGYSLCPADSGHVSILYTRPLPAAQYKLGPMTLRNTLQVLSGPAWQVKVDEVNRQVCFVLRPGYQLPDQPRPATTQHAKQSAPAPAPTSAPAATLAPASTTGSGIVVAAVPASPAITPNPTAATSPAASSSSTQAVLPPVAPAKDGPITKPTTLAPSSTAMSNSAILAKPSVATVMPAPRPLPQVWTAEPGSTLRDSVEAWAKRANWHVIWRADGLDYPIEAPLRFEGTFQDAIGQVFPLYDKAPRPFYVNVSPPSQRLIEVVEKK
ncbi:pilus assembly protein PilL [Pseudomonas sp. PIC25]|uniref:PFGI-1 class ICE element type IV pilus protein PilL2 n=1 Tax=Pseudomonas sp. PIC25 TaxID=1958773 RepID=UPI000BABC3CA|nr:TcpQ domain-containing protein [Pseudomonas sp. PIC25]PAU63305.1 pilus assembly protein PilL [Pseudomonas sp. PIC25]